MSVFSLGASHHACSTAQLSALTQAGESLIDKLLNGDFVDAGVRGHVLISTCNRWELYVDAVDFHKASTALRQALVQISPAANSTVTVTARRDVVTHLFSVASGLDSMVLGDDQISHQVKIASTDERSQPNGVLHRLFAAAMTMSKSVTTQTKLGSYSRSLASAGIQELEQRTGSLAHRCILVLGTGAFARVVVADLARRGCDQIVVASTTGRAEVFGSSHGLTAANDLALGLLQAESVICCSGAATPPITDAMLGPTRSTPLAILDLSLSGNVAEDAVTREDVICITLDDLSSHSGDASDSECEAARALVDSGVEEYLAAEKGRSASAASVALRDHITEIVDAEQSAATQRYDEQTAAAVAETLRRITGTFLHTPTARAGLAARDGSLDEYLRALYTLYGIEV